VSPIREFLTTLVLPMIAAAILARGLGLRRRPSAIEVPEAPRPPGESDARPESSLRGGWSSVASHWSVALAVMTFMFAQELRRALVLSGPEISWQTWPDAIARSALRLWRPGEAFQWLFWVMLLSAVVSAARALMPRNQRMPIGWLWIALAMIVPVRLLWGSIYLTQQWTNAQAIAILGAWGFTTAVAGRLLETPDRAAATRPALAIVAALWMVLSVSLLLSGSLVLAQFAAATAAAIGGLIIGWPRDLPIASPSLTLTLAASAMLLLGTFYARLPFGPALLLAAALVGATWTASHGRWRSRRDALQAAAVPVLLAGCALGWLGYRDWVDRATAEPNPYLQR
jgi:hypothetical protein